MAENTKPAYRDRLKGKYPDMAAQTDDDFAAMSEKYMDDSEAELGRYRDSEKAVSDLIESDPQFKAVVTDMLANGAPFIVALARNVDPEDLQRVEGDSDYDQWQQARNQRLEQAARAAEQQKEIAQNELESSKLFDDFCTEKGIEEADKETFLQVINDALWGLLFKKIDRKFLELCYKGSQFDKAVGEAMAAGEINGRNANIEAKKAQQKADAAGDGIPATGGSTAPAQTRRTRVNPMFAGIREKENF